MITPSYALTATERVLPRLALDFTTASLDPRVTFTRALNTATCVDSSGYVTVVNANLPRFDYDPVTLVCKGLLIEESRKNIYLDSANLTTANWVNANNTLNATAGTSPANTNTANSVIPTNGTAAGSAQVYQTQSCSASTAYTYSIYLKASGMTTYQLRMIVRQGGGAYIGEAQVNVDLSAVSVTTATSGTPPTNVSATITAAGNSWYRVTVTGTTTSLTGLIRCGLYNLTTGNGTNGVLAWGAQVEAGAFATSYIPTDATAGGITRNADVAYIDGANFSSFWNSSGMAFSATYDFISLSNARYVLYSATNARWAYSNAGATAVVAFDGTNVTTYGNLTTAGLVYKISGTSSSTGTAGALNGGTPGTAVSNGNLTSVPTIIFFGTNSVLFLNGHIYKVMFYNLKITNNEVQAFSKQ